MDCSRFSTKDLLPERLDIDAEPPIMAWAYTAQNGDTWSAVAECTGIDEWLLRAVNPLWSDVFFIPAGAPILIPIIPPGQIAEKVPDPTMQQGYRVLLQYPQMPAFEEPPPFDPHWAVRRWLESLVSNNRQVADAYQGSHVGSDLENLEAAFRQTMGRDLFAFLSGVLGVFKEGESPPTVEEFLAAFGDVSTAEMALFALEVADAADLKYGQMLEDPYALKYYPMSIDEFLSTQGYAQIDTTVRLREMALGYLMAANIDEMRQEVHDWDPSTEQRLLNDLEAAIQRIPPQVLGLSTEAIRAHFSRFHATMTQRQADLQSYKEMIEAYEKAQEPADWSWLLEVGIGLASNLNPVLKGIDLVLTLRDVFINREPLALLGLVDFIPPSFIRGAGRVLSRVPGANTIRRFGNDIGAWVDDLAGRFGRGAEGKLRFAGDSDNASVMRFSDETNVPSSTTGASGKGGLTEPVNKPDPSNVPRGEPEEIAPRDKAAKQANVKIQNEMGLLLAQRGYDIELIGKAGGEGADYLIGGKAFDAKAPTTNNPDGIRDLMSDSMGQASCFIIDLRRTDVTPESLLKRLDSKPLKGLDEVIVLTKEGEFVRVWPTTKK